MMDNRDIQCDIERVSAGVAGLIILIFISRRLWRWQEGISEYETFLGAVAGRPLMWGRGCWDFGLWELCPNGCLAGIAMIILVVTVIAGAIFNSRSIYLIGAYVIVGGYLVNAYLLLKFMAAY